MKKLLWFACIGAAVFCLPPAAFAQWSEDFDSYAAGSQIVGQGGWEEWAAGAGALVSNLYSVSPSNSLDINGASDVVHQYTGYTTGKWVYSARQYIPSTFTGMTYLIMLNTYSYPSGPYMWSVQVGFDATDGLIHADCGSSSPVTNVAYVTDQWALIQCFIDLDYDWVQIYYNGHLLDDPTLADHPVLGGGYQWTKGVFGADVGALNIAAVDLFANTSAPVYYDDISLMPALPWVDAKVNGQEGGLVIPQGTNVKIDYTVVAGTGEGTNVDVWVLLKRGTKWYSFDGAGPIQGWWSGLGHPLNGSGPLTNLAGTALNRTVPAGTYKAYVAIDTKANGQVDKDKVYVKDIVDFVVQ